MSNCSRRMVSAPVTLRDILSDFRLQIKARDLVEEKRNFCFDGSFQCQSVNDARMTELVQLPSAQCPPKKN